MVRQNKKLAEWIEKWNADTTLMAELNTYWARISAEHQWSKRLDGRLRSRKRTKLAYNRNDKHVKGAQQFGGTRVLSTGSCIHRNLEQGEDPSGLGRWAWYRYHGKDNLTCRVVSAYRPNGPGTGGTHTVYAQHLRHLLEAKDDRDPRIAFCEDLRALSLWIEDGDQIIVGLDANDDLREGVVNTMFTSLHMKAAIREHYPSWDSAATCNASAYRKPIDGIYTTGGIEIQAGGYRPFDEGP
jgi:hypothetical protein